jgi:hypothetical protein
MRFHPLLSGTKKRLKILAKCKNNQFSCTPSFGGRQKCIKKPANHINVEKKEKQKTVSQSQVFIVRNILFIIFFPCDFRLHLTKNDRQFLAARV